ncbi:BolA/IbaG family iron-sulfur metabolism protein [Synechococcales cyanobacterium C]|uniref:BolA/IbaG family iron-sulfur metabolism protein n=1 Tax=Petrachloros mirabilis ULC683 TaxID=2781853 RepID=A0A8K2AC66_9CYAN|nr:BolA/IbaG family iron-sulfur metabolism protein [Petrachloros mirabilis]NCJ05744.1 BolA/IbaG family iron-sulfur metabolism protein [Petrachloros mirabilis ULC683]
MISPDTLVSLIQSQLPQSQVEVQDLTGTGDHYQAIVVSESFEGKSLVQQHQLVYQAVNTLMASEELHALALKTYTPQKWEAAQQANAIV